MTDTKAASASNTAAADDDFFNSFESAPAPKPAAAAPTRPSVAPTAPKATSATAAPRTTSSASLRTASSATTSTTNAPRTINSAPKAMKLGSKLGARKASVTINFDEAERKAREEEARVAKLGYDRKKEEDERKAKEEEAKRVAATQLGSSSSNGGARSFGTGASGKPAASSAPPPPRLGFGQTFAAPVVKQAAPASSYNQADDRTYARDKFTNQKGAYLCESPAVWASTDASRAFPLPGISSDQYFGRGSYDPQASAQAQGRLQQFSGATAISSSAYFGRDEEEEAAARQARDEDGLEGLEKAAMDMVGKVLQDERVQNLGDAIRTGALKVRLFHHDIPGARG